VIAREHERFWPVAGAFASTGAAQAGQATDWLIARWEYDAASGLWDQYMYRMSDLPDDPAQPYHDQAHTTYHTTSHPASGQRAHRAPHLIHRPSGPGRETGAA